MKIVEWWQSIHEWKNWQHIWHLWILNNRQIPEAQYSLDKIWLQGWSNFPFGENKCGCPTQNLPRADYLLLRRCAIAISFHRLFFMGNPINQCVWYSTPEEMFHKKLAAILNVMLHIRSGQVLCDTYNNPMKWKETSDTFCFMKFKLTNKLSSGF